MKFREFEPLQLKQIEERFTRLSSSRLEKMLSGYNLTQSDSIRILPFLFHENHSMLPGYIDKSTPCGLPNYFPSDLDKKIAKTISRSFEYKNRAYLRFEIEALFLMGSTGTLGQSVHSDLDCWVCVVDGLDKYQLNKLQKKIDLISAWMKQRNIELNCYIVHKDDFTEKKINAAVVRKDATNLNHLLLDEFYRTAVWICGKKPLWWLVPPNLNYQATIGQLVNNKQHYNHDWIDFGEVEEIPAREYFGAAMWQQYKAIESPYKSSVKLLILEIYARNAANTGLLSYQYKTMVYEGTEDSEKLDPYLMVLQYAEVFLKENPQRLEFLRRAFYLKTGVKINLEVNSKNWRYQQMLILVKRWHWKQTRLDFLNSRPNWKINTVIKERNDVIRELTHSYHFLSNFARIEGVYDESNQKDLTSLGRKLHAVFERKSGKIDRVNNGIARDVIEPAITLFQKESDLWLLFSGSIAQNQLLIHQAVHKTNTLFELLAWCVCNVIVDKNTNYQIYSENKFYDRDMVRKLVSDLHAFEIKNFEDIDDIEYEKSAEILKIGIYLNTQKESALSEQNQGFYSVDKDSDCFCWGNANENLLDTIDVFYINSWGEYSCKNYRGHFALVELLIDHKEIIAAEKKMQIFSGKTKQANKLESRLKQLLSLWSKLLVSSEKQRANGKNNYYKDYRYLMSLGNGYLRIDFVQGEIKHTYYQLPQNLLYSLSDRSEHIVECVLDDNLALSDEIIRLLKKQLKNEHHCYVILHNKNKAEVIVTEQQGKIFYQIHQNLTLEKIVCHYQQFFDSVSQRFSLLQDNVKEYQFSLLDLTTEKPASRFISLKPQNRKIAERYARVQAIATKNSEGKLCFDIFVDEQSYFYRDYGELVYRKAVQLILSQRAESKKYPVFITDLDLSSFIKKPSLISYLEIKRKIEFKLNHIVNQLSH